MLHTILSVLYVLVCFFLIAVVLLQSGRGGGMGAGLGGSGGSNTVFGGAGAGNFLTKMTGVCAALFMILSASLAYLSSSNEQALRRVQEEVAEKDAAAKAKEGSSTSSGGTSAPGTDRGEPVAPTTAADAGTPPANEPDLVDPWQGGAKPEGAPAAPPADEAQRAAPEEATPPPAEAPPVTP